MVVAAGVEPAISWMRTRRPRPLDDATTRIILSLFDSIVNSSGSTGARRYPLSYVLSGISSWSGFNIADQGYRGFYWSTIAYSASNTYILGIDPNYLTPQTNYPKIGGFSLRCVSYSTKYPSVSAFVCVVRRLRLGQW